MRLPENKIFTDLTVIGGAKLDAERILDKTGILDICAQTADGTIVNVEVQIANQYNMEKRTLFYWSRLFSGQLAKGNDYATLKKTITVNILDFDYLPTEQYHNVYHLREDNTGHILIDVLEIHFIEMPKFICETPDIEDGLHRWLMFFSEPKEEVLVMLEEKDTKIAKATKVLDLLSSDPETVRLYELREKAVRDEVSRLNGARAEGMELGMQRGVEQGIEQGLQKGKVEIARRMLSKGSSDEDIAEMTGLTVDEVKSLRH